MDHYDSKRVPESATTSHMCTSRDRGGICARDRDSVAPVQTRGPLHIEGRQIDIGCILQWVKKPSQCFDVLERLACRKLNKLNNNLKLIYVIE